MVSLLQASSLHDLWPPGEIQEFTRFYFPFSTCPQVSRYFMNTQFSGSSFCLK